MERKREKTSDQYIIDDVLKEKGYWDEDEIQRRRKRSEEGHAAGAHAEWRKNR